MPMHVNKRQSCMHIRIYACFDMFVILLRFLHVLNTRYVSLVRILKMRKQLHVYVVLLCATNGQIVVPIQWYRTVNNVNDNAFLSIWCKHVSLANFNKHFSLSIIAAILLKAAGYVFKWYNDIAWHVSCYI
jgi:hypothetical protein